MPLPTGCTGLAAGAVALLSLTVLLPAPAQAEDLASIPLAPRVQPAGEAAARRGGDGWVGFGLGGYRGEDYNTGCRTSGGGCDDVGGYSAHGSLNLRGESLLVRLRASYFEGFTSNTAEEVALALGLPLGDSGRTHLLAGLSRLTDVANDRQSPTLGVPIELLLHPAGGMELSLHGNINDDSSFVGASLGWAFGYEP